MDLSFARIDSWMVALTLAAAMAGAWALGWSIGNRNPVDPEDKSAGRFIDGTLTLLALLLGFTFAMALNKHEQRRLIIIADSNSIGDFYTSVCFLQNPQRTQLQDAIREYVSIRLNLARNGPDQQTMEKGISDSEKLHQRMTNLSVEAVNAGTPATVSLIGCLNNLTSNHSSMLAAIRDRLPIEVLGLLAAAAVVTSMLVGRHHGAQHKRQFSGAICYVLLVALGVQVILDLNQPSKGLIRLDFEPLERLAASIAK